MTANYIAVIIMTIAAAFAGFFLKKSTKTGKIICILKSKYLYTGGGLYIFSSLLNIWLLKRMSFHIIVPLGSLCFIWTMFIAKLFLKENIGIGKIAGLLLIICGVILITR